MATEDADPATDDAEPSALPAGTRPGRVALRIGDADAVLPFYRDVLGFEVARDGEGHTERVRLLAGGDPVVVLLEDPRAPARGHSEAGLFHLAIRVPDRGALADVLARVRDAGAPLTGASDHLASEALYLEDPEGNGVEVYRDRPREAWPRTDEGGVALDTLPLDLDDLALEGRGEDRLPPGTDLGHVHLEVTDLARAEGFYADDLGLRVRARYGDGGTFLAAGDYHHHVGLNVWNRRTAPASGGRGLAWFELALPDRTSLERLADRLEARGHRIRERGDDRFVADPDGMWVRLSASG